MTKTNNHGCDHDCADSNMHEICVDHIPVSFQDMYDEYIAMTHGILTETEDLDETIEQTLKLGVKILEKYRHSMQELELYKAKFTPVPPDDLEMSNLKNCFIGKCKCGQLVIENRDRCCPKCNQFILWPHRCK